MSCDRPPKAIVFLPLIKDWCCDCPRGRLGWFAGLRGSESSDLESVGGEFASLLVDFFLKIIYSITLKPKMEVDGRFSHLFFFFEDR